MENLQELGNEFEMLRDVESEFYLDGDGERKNNRTALLRWLRSVVGDATNENSIAELVVRAEKEGHARVVAGMLLRARAAGSLPEADSNNEVGRSLVALAEQGLPELYAYLRIDGKAQSYIKLQRVSMAHDEVRGLLAPLNSQFSDIDAALDARKPILGCLNHSLVQKYAAAFDLKMVKLSLEDLFHKLKLIHSAGPDFLVDIESCRESIRGVRQAADDGGSFLAREFLIPLVDCIERALVSFVSSCRNQFTTAIKARFSMTIQKRYPLHEVARELQISIPFKNVGPGMATSMVVSIANESDAIFLVNRVIHLGNVLPGDFSILLDVQVIEAITKANFTVLMEWGEIGEVRRKSEAFEVQVNAQSADIDWSSREYWRPYSTEPAEGEEFVGRIERVRSLAAKMLRSPMESFYITGQKRVGKTSLALAAVEFAKENSGGDKIEHSYNLWGSFAHADPRLSMEALGRSIEDLIRSALPFPGIDKLDFTGSLAPLMQLSRISLQLSPDTRFVVVVDEFDEIHQELYLHGNLAETFFANLRALSRCKNICLVLVGGENMPYVMERQGQKLNNFARINLNYYDRAKEWADFKLMVHEPVVDVIHWHEDAVSEVFNISNGNPFFAKVVCAAAVETAVQSRDADVSAEEIRYSNDLMIPLLGSNSFAHLWQDGVPKPPSLRDPDILLRTRVLVAFARCRRRRDVSSLANIFANRSSSNLSEAETSAVLKDFIRREVLSESNGLYEFKLPIFERWLVEIGAGQLAADSLTEELANAAQAEELSVAVRSDEIATLVRSWPSFRGRHLGTDDVRAWIQQVDSLKDQRLLFEILKRVRIMSDARVREMLRNSFAFLHPLPEFVMRKKSDRRKNIIVTYVDGEGKSGPSYASIFSEENFISGDCIFPPGEFEKRIERHLKDGNDVDVIAIVDDLVGTGRSLLRNVSAFLDRVSESIPSGTPVRVISMLSTVAGQSTVLEGLQRLDFANVDFRVCELLSDDLYAFGTYAQGILGDDFDRAKALCVDLGRRIYRANPLGFGDQGLLVVFPTNTPNNSLPILHTPARAGNQSWKPIFERVTH